MPILASSELIAARVAICRQCPHAVRIGNLKMLRCQQCGCPIAGKVRLRGAKCPVGKWLSA